MFKYVQTHDSNRIKLLSHCKLNKIKQIHSHSWACACPSLQQLVSKLMVRWTFEWIGITLRDIMHGVRALGGAIWCHIEGNGLDTKKNSIGVHMLS